MSQYGDMRPLFSGAHIVSPTKIDYKDQRADFLAMTLVEKRLGMLKKFNFIGYADAPPDEIDESVLEFATLLGKYHRALSEEDNLTLTGKGKYGLRPDQLKFGNDGTITLSTDSNVDSYLMVTEFRRND